MSEGEDGESDNFSAEQAVRTYLDPIARTAQTTTLSDDSALLREVYAMGSASKRKVINSART